MMSIDPIWSLMTPTPLQVGVGVIIAALVAGCMFLGRKLRQETLAEGSYGKAYAWRPLPKRRSSLDGGDDTFDGGGDGGGD